VWTGSFHGVREAGGVDRRKEACDGASTAPEEGMLFFHLRPWNYNFQQLLVMVSQSLHA